MKHTLRGFCLLLGAVFSLVAAQEEPYQVQGFPPFAPAPQMLEVLEDRGETVLELFAGESE